MRCYTGWSDDINSLQVVMTYATDHKYRFRCLPWFLHKWYLNRYVFDGVARKNWKVNEVYMWHQYVDLSSNGYESPMEQLYRLFVEYGIDDTFVQLSTIAKSSADMFLLHKSLYNTTYDPYLIARKIEDSISEDIALYKSNPDISLDRIISAATYDLLYGMSVYIKKKN